MFMYSTERATNFVMYVLKYEFIHTRTFNAHTQFQVGRRMEAAEQ